MPVSVIKYTCQFKCGHRAIANKAQMQEHEDKVCFKNPINQTCETCINRIYDRDSDEYKSWSYRGCKLKIMNEFLETIQEDLRVEPSNHIKPLFHCPNHNKQEEVGITYQYINRVKEKIENKKKGIETFEFNL